MSGELSPSDAKPITQVIGESPVWSEDIVQLLERAKQVPEKDERLPLDGVLRQAVQEVFAQDPKLPSNLLLSAILAQRADPAVAAWLQNNKVVAKAIVSPVFRFLEDLRTRVQTLEQRLSEEVLGQENAIQMLVNAYWEACLGRKSEGPRGIFTFLGPPGVGKTLLAERFAAVLQEIEGERVAFRRFDMGSFAGPQNFEQLFGAEGFYKAARPGTLTGFVAENPRAVILLDEIEKA
ncbi:AAA family ATPase, partial [Thermoanaerobaculum aquaticum]|uniref:AAA family ATPase n=1 Tax=Thermoanaerobaculum aquaticum TaxID=1312852 RepID=UPI001377F095